MKRKVIITICLIVFLLAAYLLLTGSELLLFPLIERPLLPLGNALTWLGFIAFPLAVWYGMNSLYFPETRTERILRTIAVILVVLGLLWLPVTLLLANNLSGEFSGSAPGFRGSTFAGEIFWVYSYSIAAGPIILVLITLIVRLVSKRKR